MKRLIILPNNIGDVIMAAPLFEGLKRKNPDDELHFLVDSGYEGGVLNNPFIDKIHLIPRSESAKALRDEESFPVEAFSLGAWVETLSSAGFDQIINLSQHGVYSALASLIDAKEKIGMELAGEGVDVLHGYWNHVLFAVPYSRRCASWHAIDLYKKICGIEGDRAEPKIFLSELEKQSASAKLKEFGWNGTDRIAVFQPGSAVASKMWASENWSALGNRLAADDVLILITGAPSEEQLCRETASKISGKVIVSAGKTTFRESAALASFAFAVVTGDTALMHAAAALGVPVYALFGSTSPVETGPYGNGHAVFAAGSCAKQPCFLHSCERSVNCIDEISADSVYSAICGGSAPYRTKIDSGAYALLAENGEPNRWYDQAETELLRAVLQKTVPSAIDPILKARLSAFRDRTDEAHRSLSRFAAGDQQAYGIYGEQIQSLQQFEGVGAFLAAMINIGLNSIPLTDMAGGIEKMLSVLHSFEIRLTEVLNG